AYQDALRISQPLAEADPQNAQAQTDLFVVYWKLGSTERGRFEYAKATEWYGKARAVVEPLHKAGKLAGPFQTSLAMVDRQLAFCRTAERAVEDLDFALNQPAELVPDLLVARSTVLARRGRHAEAA